MKQNQRLWIIIGALATTLFTAPAIADPPQSVLEFNQNGKLELVEHWDGRRYRINYDSMDRVRRVEMPDQGFSWEYDDTGRRKSATSELGTVRFNYDSFDRPRELRIEPTGTKQAKFVHYEYDLGGHIKNVTVMDNDRTARYSIDVQRDLIGRVKEMTLGEKTVAFEYKDNKIVRQNPDGVRTTFAYDVHGLLSSVRHEDLKRNGALISETTYDFNPTRQQITVGQDIPGKSLEFRTFDAGTQHLRQGVPANLQPVYGFEGSPSLKMGAEGILLHNKTAKTTQRFIRIPFDQRGELLLEMSPKGEFTHALVAGERIAFEHSLKMDSKRFHLENSYHAPHEIISQRTIQGPVAKRSWDKNSWQSALSAIDSQVKQPFKSTTAITNMGLSVLQIWGKHKRWENIDRLARPFEVLDWTGKFYRDFMDFSTSKSSFQERIRKHVALGNTSEALVGKLVENVAKKMLLKGHKGHIGGFYAKETVDLGYDFMRGKNLTNPDVVEHLVDMIALGGVSSWIAVQTGNPAIAGPLASALKNTANFGRTKTRPHFERGGAWWGRTSSRVQGQHVWQLATAAIRGNPEQVRDIMGDLGDSTRLPWGKDKANKFQATLFAGDWATAADMLPSFRRKLHSAGYTDEQISQLQNSLRAGTITQVPTGNFSEIQSQLGGIALETIVDFAGNLGNIEGAVYDQVSGTLVLVGDGALDAPRMDPEYLAVAIYCIFGPYGRGPSFSLDPAEPTNPDGPWQKAVYRPEYPLRNSRFGYIMWVTDWAMKQAAFSTEVRYGSWLNSVEEMVGQHGFFEIWNSGESRSFTLVDHDRRYQGFDSVVDIALEHPEWMSQGGLRARQWIVVKDEKVTIRTVKGALVFEPIQLDVKAKKMERGVGGRLRDVESDEPISSTFAKSFAQTLNNNLDQIAKREPAFAELPNLVKAIAFARWLRDQRIPVDLTWIKKRLHLERDSVDRVSRITTSHTVHQGNWAISIYLAGGVDFNFRIDNKHDDGRASDLRRAVAKKIRHTDSSFFRLTDGRVATVLPFTPQGRALWNRTAVIEKDGVRYLLGTNGQVRSAQDLAGNLISYQWNNKGELVGVTEQTPNGWRIQKSQTGETTVLETRTPDGGLFKTTYKEDGSMMVAINGKIRLIGHPLPMEGYEIREIKGNELGVTKHDKKDRLVSYRRESSGKNGKTSEQLKFEYNQDGQIKRMLLDEKPLVILKWQGEQLDSMTTASRYWDYEYDKKGLLRRIRGTGGDSIETVRSKNGTKTFLVKELGMTHQFEYRHDRLMAIIDPFMGKTKFHYDKKGRLKREERKGQTTRIFRYDKKGRIFKAQIKGKAEVRFKYAKRNRIVVTWDKFCSCK